MWVLTGVILLLASAYSGLVGYSDSGSTDVDVPSCALDELQGLGEGVDFCDKSMMMDSEMKVAIVGSRNYPDLEKVKKYVRKLSPGDIIVSGGGNGVDETVRRK